jgi:thioredoxin reductase (NADPH)
VSCQETGDSWQVDAQHMFLFIGADPNTQWLDRRIALDNKGFVLTGQASQLPLETSSRGVFAIGDVRKGSIKRVASGVGEGAAAVAQFIPISPLFKHRLLPDSAIKWVSGR